MLGITGLDNAAPLLTADEARRPARRAAKGSCSSYYGQHIVAKLPPRFGTTDSRPEVCGYSAAQLRAAYGANTTNTGKGQKIALIELGLASKMFLTLQDYAKAEKMPAPSRARYTELDQQPKSCGFDEFAIEEQLDVEASYAMAPGANQLVVGGNSCNDGDFGLQGVYDADARRDQRPRRQATRHDRVQLLGETAVRASRAQATNIAHAYLVKAASEGVGMYFSSGDTSGIGSPSDDPFAIAVGGTTLGLGKTSNRLFETGWSDGAYNIDGHAWSPLEEDGAAGGGPSLVWRQPKYQKGVVPASMSAAPGGNRGGPVRSVPDISAVADSWTGMLIGIVQENKIVWREVGGTSLAAPLVAGVVAAAQQGQARPFGFLNPTFYKLAGTSAFHDALPLTRCSPAVVARRFLRDVADLRLPCFCTCSTTRARRSGGYNGQVMLKGYDTMTGVGTPNGQDFIDACARPAEATRVNVAPANPGAERTQFRRILSGTCLAITPDGMGIFTQRLEEIRLG